MSVDTPCQEYLNYSSRWQRIADSLEGSYRVKERGDVYLSPLDGEETTSRSYKLRKDLAKWYDAPSRTVDMLCGMINRRDPIVRYDSKLEEVIDDVTMTGISFNTFISRVVMNVISFARYGVLVDYNDLGKRPYIVGYLPLNIINWRQEMINGVVKVTLVVLREYEEVVDQKDFFTSTNQERYRVLALDENGYYYQQVYHRVVETSGIAPALFAADEPVYPTVRGDRFKKIPFFFFGKGDLEADIERSPIEAIVDLAYHYYQLSADFFWGLHFTALPTPVVINGGETPPDTLGPQFIWSIEGEGADAKFLTFAGDGMQLLHDAGLEADKREMSDLGARILETKGESNVSARTVEMKSFSDSASLAGIAQTTTDGMQAILDLLHEWSLAVASDASVEINKDFLPTMMDPSMLQELVAAVQAGKLSTRELFDLLKAGEVIRVDKTYEEHMEEIDEDESKIIPQPSNTPFQDPSQFDPNQPNPNVPNPTQIDNTTSQ